MISLTFPLLATLIYFCAVENFPLKVPMRTNGTAVPKNI